VVGYPPHWQWFPERPRARYYRRQARWTLWAEDAWARYFSQRTHPAPTVYLSAQMPIADGRTYHWGIVVSRARWRRRPRAERGRWLRGLLLHELLHWAGYSHNAAFRRAAQALGTW